MSDTDPSATPEGQRPKGTQGPWVWVLVAALACALVALGVWTAYRSGVDAGRTAASSPTGTVEATSTAATGTASPVTTASLTADAGASADDEDPAAPDDPAPSTQDPPPAQTPQPSSTPTPAPKKGKPPIIKKVYVVPTTWTTVSSSMGSGWGYTGARDLKAGYMRMRLRISHGHGATSFVQLIRVDPPGYTEYLWLAPATTGVDWTSPPILITAGSYKCLTGIDGDWSINLEQ